MIKKLLLNTQVIWMVFIKTFKNSIQTENKKHWFYSIIWLLICLAIKIFNPIATELLIRGKKLNIFPAFITQSYFAGPKHIRQIQHTIFLMKIPNKGELQQIAFNCSLHI